MGNVVANIQKKIRPGEDIPTPEMKTLTTAQVEIIKKTWEPIQMSPFEKGEKILFAYFERYPINQEKFPAFRNTPLLLLKGTPGFRSHASKIMNVFSCAIDGLDKENGLKEIAKIIAHVGKTHAEKKVTKRSMIEMREVLTEKLVELCHLDDEAIEAWNTLLDIVWHIMFTCFDGEWNKFM